MHFARHLRLPLLLIFVLAAFSSGVRGAPPAEKRAELAEMWQSLVEAGKRYKAGNSGEAAALVGQVQKSYHAFDAEEDPQLQQLLDRIHRSLSNAHAAMRLDGIKLPPLKRRVLGSDEPASGESPPEPTSEQVSFAQQVAPILLQKCGRCHVSDTKGRFNAGTYAGLMRGSESGRVIFAGNPDGSPLVELIESGDMPRGSGKLNSQQLATLKKWIAQGARSDAPSPDTPLTQLTSANAESAPAPQVETDASSRDGVSFGRHVAPVLANSCTACHGTQRQRNNFSLATFERLLRGGDSGPPIVPGKPSESLLVKKLRGQAGERMPLNLPALPEATIAAIERWIAAGATFDGPSPTMPVERVATVVRSSTATHQELSEQRSALAADNWKLALPGVEQRSDSTENFLLVGSVDESTLAELGKVAEEVAPEVASIFKAPADKPLVKGRMTLFAFGQRYDYTEFGQMVEKRNLSRQWQGHWKYDTVDAYGCLTPSRSGEYSSKALIAQQLAGVYVASQGDVPRWFAEGSGRVAAARLAGDDSRVQAWDDSLPGVLGEMQKADDFLTGALAEEQAMVAAYSFVEFLMKDARRYQRLLASLRQGDAFDEAFAAAYGGSPSQVAQLWVRRLRR